MCYQPHYLCDKDALFQLALSKGSILTSTITQSLEPGTHYRYLPICHQPSHRSKFRSQAVESGVFLPQLCLQRRQCEALGINSVNPLLPCINLCRRSTTDGER